MISARSIKSAMGLAACAAALVAAFGIAGAARAADSAGMIKVDGSSTVFPISEAVAEEFQNENARHRVTVGISGTGGGFKKFSAGEIDITDASRPIKETEIEAAKKGGIEFVELPVAYDGLSILVNPKNKFVDHLTVAELKMIWEPESKVKTWKDVRPAWPANPINLYGPGHDSGTFDYFTEAINGKEKSCRADYTASEDDNTLVQGISGDPNALGYFGYGYYEENKKKLKLVPVDGGKGPLAPSKEAIITGAYQPLSRPLFIYVSVKSLARPEVMAFAKFYLKHAKDLVSEVGYVPLPDNVYGLALKRLEAKKTGSVFKGKGSQPGVLIEDLLKAESE